jgi:diguanylate cyclase (GGDEF)-like protein/PAS domain S-box-containing protein
MLSFITRAYRQSPAAFIVLAVGLTYSFFGWIYARAYVEREAHRAFEQQVIEARNAVSDAVRGYTELLYGLQGLFGAVKDVNRAAFRRYVDMSDIANRYPGTLAFSFIREVPLHKKETYEEMVRRDRSVHPDGYPDFAIRPDEIKPAYWVIEYVAPAEDTRALGRDISSSPSLYAAGLRARDSGQPATAARPNVDRAESANLVIYVPVYKGDLPQRTVEQRRRAFIGLVAVVARPSDLIAGALETARLRDIRVAVHDLGVTEATEFLPPTLVYESSPETAGEHEGEKKKTTIQVGGRLWQLTFTPQTGYAGMPNQTLPWLVLLTGLIASVLLFSLLRRLALSNATTLRLAEELKANMRAREARFRSLTENAMEVISVLNERGVVLYQTPSAERVFGLKAQDMLGSSIFDRIHPDDLNTMREAVAQLSKRPEQVTMLEFRLRGADGSWRAVETSWNNRLEDPAVKGIVVNWRDVSSRKRAEADLKESEERFKIVASATNDAVWDWDLITDTVSWNEGIRILFGYTEREGANQRGWWIARIHPEDRERTLSDIDALIAGGSRLWSGEYRFLRADGSYAYVLDRGYVMRDATGKPVRMIGAILDLSERNRAEQALKESEQRYRSLVTATASVVWVANRDGEFVAPQPSWEAYTRQRYAEYRGHGWLAAIHPHDREHVRGTWKRALNEQSLFEVEGRVWHSPSHDYRWFVMRAVPLSDGDSGVREWIGIVRDVTGRKQAEAALRESEGQLRLVSDSLPVLIAYVDAEERFRFNNAAYQRWFNISGENLAGRKVAEVLGDDTYCAVKPYLQQALSGRTVSYDRQITLKDGQQRYVHATYVPHIEEHGRVRGFFSLVTDITERKKGEEALAESEEKFRVIAENVEDLIVLLDTEGRRLYNSPSYGAVLGDVRAGADSFAEVHPEDRERIRKIFEQTVKTGIGHRTQFRFLLKDGSVRHIESQGSVIRDASGKVSKVVVVSRDITERKHAEAYIRHLAHHDGLTGLPNRVLLADRLGLAIVQANREHRRAGVLFIDLDRFKEVNDKLGHQAGDRLLQMVAERLSASVREGDTVARLGGDEFVVLLPNIRDHDDTQRVANKILENVSRPYTLEGHAFMVTPSIGIAVFPDDGANVEDLMRDADAAMYHAKQMGRNNCQFFNPAMNPVTNARFTIESQLRRALEQDQLLLHYQPIVDVRSGEIRSVEALLRWQQPGGGLSLPGKLIPIAEESGLIVPIGEWVLKAACETAKRFREIGLPNLRVAINLSPRHFRKKELASHIAEVLNECGLSPQNLELEVTENVIMEFGEESVAVLRAVKEMGVALTVDDFGTGYSSLSYLKHFPVDRLKVDKLFVREVTSDADDAAIVTAVVAMAHGLQLKVVAEGVETQGQLDFLRAHDCDEAQGSYFSPPLTADELLQMLASKTAQREAGRVIQLRGMKDEG